MENGTVLPDQSQSRPVGVTRVDLDRLFRQYDHHIPLRAEDRVTILHGRNGVGKTVTLSLVAALLRGNYSLLARYPFERLRITFTDGAFLEVRPGERGEGGEVPPKPKGKGKGTKARNVLQGGPALELSYGIPGGESGSVPLANDIPRFAADVARRVPWLARIDDDRWMDQRMGEILTAEAL